MKNKRARNQDRINPRWKYIQWPNNAPRPEKPLDFAAQLQAKSQTYNPSAHGLTKCVEAVRRVVRWLAPFAKKLTFRRARRRSLSLLDLQQLGEKRFVAVVRVGKAKFLIGGGATSVALLAELSPDHRKPSSGRMLTEETA